MSIDKYFESGEQKQVKGHFSNLVKIANADGNIDEQERTLLQKLAKSFHITEAEFEDMLNHDSDYAFMPPVLKEDRYSRFVNLVKVVLADGKIGEFEMKTLKRLAVGLDLPLLNLDSVVKTIQQKIEEGVSTDDIVEDFEGLISE